MNNANVYEESAVVNNIFFKISCYFSTREVGGHTVDNTSTA